MGLQTLFDQRPSITMMWTNKTNQMALAIFILAFSLIRTQLALLTAIVVALATTYGAIVILHSSPRPGAPGPSPFPILGSLHLMNGYRIAYAAFTKLTREYGNVFSMKLGSSWCVVVNDAKTIKEVLITKGAHFDGRPNLKRFAFLFGGDKENSLAFADNSDEQKGRKNILKKFTFPHAHSDLGTKLDQLCMEECQHLVQYIRKSMLENQNDDDSKVRMDMKPLVAKACANIFNRFFCSVERCSYEDKEFEGYCQNFDEVFWEVNNGRAVDFLPWLMPFFQQTEAAHSMKEASHKVRKYVEENIIESKRQKKNDTPLTKDLLDSIMIYIDSSAKEDSVGKDFSSQSALYALEDILGGSCAVANIILRILFDLALDQPNRAHVQDQIKNQIHTLHKSNDGLVSIEDRVPLLKAAMHETIRLTCSPIVPHQATQDSEIGGYHVPKDTVIFINNHLMNMSPELWEEPEKYMPTRFLDGSGDFTKPAHFQPFSMGKRACMGYKMVQHVSFSIVSNLMANFDLSEPSTSPETISLGMLALPPEPFEFILKERQPETETAESFDVDQQSQFTSTKNKVMMMQRPNLRNVA